jgi:hypothetical protein
MKIRSAQITTIDGERRARDETRFRAGRVGDEAGNFAALTDGQAGQAARNARNFEPVPHALMRSVRTSFLGIS